MVDYWVTDVSWVWWIPNHNAVVLPHNNIRNNQILHHQGPKYYTTSYDVPMRTTTPKLQSIILPRVTPPEYYTTKALDYYTTKAPDYYTSKAPEYYTSKAPEYYTTKAPEYYTTTYAVPAF
jgi:hypothetical protein